MARLPFLSAIAVAAPALAALVLVSQAPAQTTIIADFEGFADTAALQADWDAGVNTTVELGTDVASESTGTQSLQMNADLPDVAWSTASTLGPVLSSPVDLTDKNLTLRVKGDSAVATADPGFASVYVYFYDASDSNLFSRIDSQYDMSSDSWTTLTLDPANSGEPWNSDGPADQTNINRFEIVWYGQGETPVGAYAATLYFDDLATVDAPTDVQDWMLY